MRGAPGSVHIVVGRTHESGVGIRQPPLLGSHIDAVGRHLVIAARLQGAHTLRHQERLAGEILRYILHPLVMIVETDDVDSPALEEMVVGIGFVASCRNRTGGVVFFHDFCQMARQK